MSKPLTNFHPARVQQLPWPVPALAAWACAWLVFRLLEPFALPLFGALALACMPPLWAAVHTPGLTRRVLLLSGFPVSLMLLDASAGPAWMWLLPAGLLLMLYPLRAWRDAPLYPTGRQALRGLAAQLSLPPQPRMLDAGCGVGHGLQALAAEWPAARLGGLEHSAPLALLARLRCPASDIRRGDMWQHDWSSCDLLYLFQRPESMERAWSKACREMKPGAWLVSLEFPVTSRTPDISLQTQGQRPVWAYRVPQRPQPSALPADMPKDATAIRAVG